MQKSKIVFAWFFALTLSGCVNPPGQITWEDILFRDGPKTLEECLANVDHHYDDRYVFYNFQRVGRVGDMPFAGFFRGLQYDHCRNNFDPTPAGITVSKAPLNKDAETPDSVAPWQQRNSDQFDLLPSPNDFNGLEQNTENLVDLLPKPARKKSSQEIYQERLQEYLNSPLRGAASDVVSTFRYDDPVCRAGAPIQSNC